MHLRWFCAAAKISLAASPLLEMIAPTTGATDVTMKTKNQLDQRVGERLRSRRLKMGLSQTELGAAAGVTFSKCKSTKKGPTGSAPAA